MPVPERDPSGQAVLTLWLFGQNQSSRLQFGVQWTAEQSTLQALAAEIVRRYPERKLTAASIRLMPAQVDIDSVTLAIGDGSGTFADLQSVRSSGYPPFSALFNTALTSEQSGQATAALNGSPDRLTVTYRGQVQRSGQGAAQLAATADLSRWLPAGTSANYIRSIS
ncbi:hypothetical protein ACFPVX_03000 [Cohnella faecalis]|uniref:Uncharacterized protein n=1 Tax=Cohnella faecalis TaxID=2315694 RepID=A0A398CWB1_9BACL|nr:hypothetical protein [Cohnella faecalis]RIE03501.1 hypothetical protein D3H35_12700 [Cohnella faecalis]